jgi:hypothetical protein
MTDDDPRKPEEPLRPPREDPDEGQESGIDPPSDGGLAGDPDVDWG